MAEERAESSLWALAGAAICSAIFIATSIFCIVEVAARIAAISYVDRKSGEIEERLARSVDVGDYAVTVSRRSDLAQLAILRQISDELGLLDFSGAQDRNNTVVAIRQRLSAGIADAQMTQSIQENNLLTVRWLNEISFARQTDALSVDFVDDLAREMPVLSVETQERFSSLQMELSGFPRISSSQLGNSGSQIADAVRESVPQTDQQIRPLPPRLDPGVPAYLFFDLSGSVSGTPKVLGFLSEVVNEIASRRNEIVRDSRESSVPSVASMGSGLVRFNLAYYLATDLLIAVSVIFSGAIGAIAAATRGRASNFFKATITGFLAGFVALLIVKGGKSLLYAGGGSDQLIIINPYAFAFAGVIAGLFTERAFAVLSALVDELSDRIMGEATSSNGAGAEEKELSPPRPPASGSPQEDINKPIDAPAPRNGDAGRQQIRDAAG